LPLDIRPGCVLAWRVEVRRARPRARARRPARSGDDDGLPAGAAGILLLLVLWIVGVLQRPGARAQRVDESWAGIDTELKRRHDLVPNLVETVKGYAAHERGTLEAVIQARNTAAAPQASPAAAAQAENALSAGLRQIFALSERYPTSRPTPASAAAGRAGRHRGPHPARAHRLQRQRARAEHEHRGLPRQHGGQLVRLLAREFFELKDAEQREAPKVSFKA
jgi:LemA protein